MKNTPQFSMVSQLPVGTSKHKEIGYNSRSAVASVGLAVGAEVGAAVAL